MFVCLTSERLGLNKEMCKRPKQFKGYRNRSDFIQRSYFTYLLLLIYFEADLILFWTRLRSKSKICVKNSPETKFINCISNYI